MKRREVAPAELRERLIAAARRSDAAAEVDSVARIPKGISSLTYSVVISWHGRKDKAIVKVAPPGLMPNANRDILRQARLYRALAGASDAVPIPEVLLMDEGQPPQTPPLFAMSLLPGDTIDPTWPGDALLPDDVIRERGLGMARALAALHAIPVDVWHGEPRMSAMDEVDRWTSVYATVHEQLRGIAGQCRQRLGDWQPEPMPDAINHGDYRFGNVLFDDTEVTGLIDWEIAAIQDPRFDLANLVLYCGPDSPLRLRTTVYAHSRHELVDAYERAAGIRVRDLDWFMIALRYKCAAALALLVKRNAKLAEPDPLLVEVGLGLPEFLDAALTPTTGSASTA
jgi:aminoglycoside phosphotransferase (APT) family kinase protein